MVEDISTEEVLREESSHGDIWNNMHGGYFSSPDIAAPYVAKIADVVDENTPDTVVDLGGGTGFILDQLSQKTSNQALEFIDLELSEEQLDSIQNEKIIPIRGSIVSFKRDDLGRKEKRFLYICRSALHYSGLDGLKPLVKHIRDQMLPEEYFVHQTACFSKNEDADILNLIYDMMGTEKGYPNVSKLSEILTEEGFEVSEISKAASLELTSESLMKRYNFDNNKMRKIIDSVINEFGTEKEGVFRLTSGGFTAYLHYMVFICRAV